MFENKIKNIVKKDFKQNKKKKKQFILKLNIKINQI